MCFDPGRDAPHFQAFTALMYFWAANGESLDAHWKFGNGTHFRGLKIEFAPDSVSGAEPAWPPRASAGAAYTSTGASGRLKMLAAAPSAWAWPLEAGRLYVAARLL